MHVDSVACVGVGYVRMIGIYVVIAVACSGIGCGVAGGCCCW